MDLSRNNSGMLQQQLYGKSLTPTTQKLDQQAKQAQRVSTIVAWVLYVCMALAGTLAAELFAI